MLRDAGVAGEPLASAEAAMSDFYRSQGFREDAADHLRLAAQVRAAGVGGCKMDALNLYTQRPEV